MFMFDHCFNNGILLRIIPLTETLSFTVYIIRKTGISFESKNLMYSM
uniref:Alternative protein PIP4K2A n=1 Tax=Homo sapiens TaxID=9606 RepID=L8EAD2_HUMAN|nr:alternative protein PIP4K2A [Homo sapiens]